jgi:hypothetical protein
MFPTFHAYDCVKHKVTNTLYRVMAQSMANPDQYWCREYGESLKPGEGSMGQLLSADEIEPHWWP